MNQFTMEQKLEVVRAWRASGQTQEVFCAERRWVAPRTLRTWARLYRRPDDALERARAVVAEAVEELATILKTIEAAVEDREVEADRVVACAREEAVVTRHPSASLAAAPRPPAEHAVRPTAGAEAPPPSKTGTAGWPGPAAAFLSTPLAVEAALPTTVGASRRPETLAERRARKRLANPNWKYLMEDL